ncbi:hypothetical protein B0H34DRAFT_797579 [Crassisporium funariophilum]|nr:hypothetical protein B0H34DRAFT_797579 [Crassisporium funariophilum]
MQFNTFLLCIFTFFSYASAYAIPIQRIRLLSPLDQRSPSEIARIIGRQESPSTTITLIAAGSVTPIRSTTSDIQPTTTSTNIVLTSESSTETLTSTTVSVTSSPTQAPTASSSVTSSPQPSQPPADTDGSRKYVVAHHMVGNTFPYISKMSRML